MKPNIIPLLAAAAIAATAHAATPAPAAPAPSTAAKESAAAPFTAEERDLLINLAADVSAALKESGIAADVPISALPFPGDRDRYLEGLLKNAVTAAGLNYVEGRGDPMWDAIVNEIIWDWRKNDVLDEATLTKFGRLQAARRLLYGHIIVERDDEDELRAELWLHISSVETKQHLWGRTFVKRPGQYLWFNWGGSGSRIVDFPIVLADAQLRVAVRSVAADQDQSSKTLADAMGSDARDTLANAGFAVFNADAAKDPEVAISIKSSAPAFDREDDYVRFKGNVEIVATVPADGNRIIGEKTMLERRAKRALGDMDALNNLREDMVLPLRDWLGKTVTQEKVGLSSVTLQADFANLKEPELEQRITALVDATRHLEGVRDARVVSRLPLPDGTPGLRVTLRVLFRPVDVPEGLATRLVAKRPDLFRKVKKAK